MYLGYSHNTGLGSSLDLLLVFARYLGNTKKKKKKKTCSLSFHENQIAGQVNIGWLNVMLIRNLLGPCKLQVICLNLQYHNLLSTSSPTVVPVCFFVLTFTLTCISPQLPTIHIQVPQPHFFLPDSLMLFVSMYFPDHQLPYTLTKFTFPYSG